MPDMQSLAVDSNAAAGRTRATASPFMPRASGRRRATLYLTLAFWVSNYAFLTLGTLLSGSGRLAEVTAVRAGLLVVGLVLCFLIYGLLERRSALSFRKKVVLAVLLAPVASEIYAWASYFGYGFIDPARFSQAVDWSETIFYLASWTWFFLAWAALYLALDYSFDIKDEQQRSSELQSLAHAAKLKALHNQVNPHFLFNGLNSISALILDGRTGEADQMLFRLADFFRRTLAVDPLDDISLEQEVDLQSAYLEIEKLRYPDLAVSIELPEALRRAAVPALILQPVVENAVKYGVGCSAPPARIAIAASRDEDNLVVEVRDWGSGSGPDGAKGAGIGLRNVRERLAQRFRGRCSMTTGWQYPRGFKVTIRMPMVVLP